MEAEVLVEDAATAACVYTYSVVFPSAPSMSLNHRAVYVCTLARRPSRGADRMQLVEYHNVRVYLFRHGSGTSSYFFFILISFFSLQTLLEMRQGVARVKEDEKNQRSGGYV